MLWILLFYVVGAAVVFSAAIGVLSSLDDTIDMLERRRNNKRFP